VPPADRAHDGPAREAPGRADRGGPRSLTAVFGGLALLVAAFVKGAIGFGFPTIATPLLALATDVRTAVVVLLLPNILMDAIQVTRLPGLQVAARRHAGLVVAGVVGTQFLALVSSRALLALLGSVVLTGVVVSLARPAWRLPPSWEPVASPVAGLVAGVLGGLTNVPGTPLALYFQALGLPKGEFVRGVALTFLALKLTQLGAVWQVGLMAPRLLVLSAGATAVALLAFRAGLWAQDRVPADVFNRAVPLALGVLSIAMLVRAIWS
jgi:uncharacterized protein